MPLPDNVAIPCFLKHHAGVPKPLLRSELFAAVRVAPQVVLVQSPVAALSDISIKQSGPVLTQTHLSVWMACIAACQGCLIDEDVRRTEKVIFRWLGVNAAGGRDAAWLRRHLDDLAKEFIEISVPYRDVTRSPLQYSGPMLPVQRDGKRLSFHYTREFAALFAEYAQFDMRKRRQLSRRPLALWLVGYYKTHLVPRELLTSTVRRLCGSQNESLSSFRAELHTSLKAAVSTGEVRSWKIDERDHLRVRPRLSKPQLAKASEILAAREREAQDRGPSAPPPPPPPKYEDPDDFGDDDL